MSNLMQYPTLKHARMYSRICLQVAGHVKNISEFRSFPYIFLHFWIFYRVMNITSNGWCTMKMIHHPVPLEMGVIKLPI